MIKDYKVGQGTGIAAKIIVLPYTGTIPADQADVELLSFRLPDNTDWMLKRADAWCKSVTGAAEKQVNIRDDGAALGTLTTVVAGAQTQITGATNKSIKGGSEVQVYVKTGATTTITDLVVTLYFEPLYLYQRTATPSPS